jgi:hypothetical protein
MKIAFDIGGVISKYPETFHWLMTSLAVNMELYIITDMHDKTEVMKMLRDNNVEVPESRVYCADYTKHGDMCKAVLLKELGIDIFIDDFLSYTSWDSSLGSAPIRLLVAPDPFKPYWSDTWKCEGADFGRRKFSGL